MPQAPQSTNQQIAQPLLHGITILDLTRILAGPYCTMTLGDLGAEVIKIEQPGTGDGTRQWGPPFAQSEKGESQSAYYLCVNRNKRSLALDLRTDAGRAIVRDLARRADVLVENFTVGKMAEWGLDFDSLRQDNPALIYASITGYGQEGPWAARPGYDYAIQAVGGLMSITGPADGPPMKVGVAIADLFAGQNTAQAILAALFARERAVAQGRKPQAQRIDISLLDSQVAMLANVAGNFLVSGQRPARFGNDHANIVPYSAFPSADEWWVLAVGSDGQFQRLCRRVIDRPHLADDPRFATNPDRVQHRDALVDLLTALFRTQPAAHWLAACQAADVPAAPINPVDRVFENPQVQHRAMRQEISHPTLGSVSVVASPLTIPTAPPTIRRHPPRLGEHSAEILAELGYNEAQIQALVSDGIVQVL